MKKRRDVDEDAAVRDWFRRIRASESAKRTYKRGMQYYLDFVREKGVKIGSTPSEMISYGKARRKADVDEWEDEIEGVMAEFEEWLHERPKTVRGDYGNGTKLAPKTVHGYLTAVRSFYTASRISVPRQRGRGKPKTLEENNRRLTKEIVREALKYADVRTKAIMLCMLSGGLGDSEVLNLKVGTFIRGRSAEPLLVRDLRAWIEEEKRKCEEQVNAGNLEYGITMLSIRRPKTEVDYLTFITPEATLAVLNYLAWRNRPSEYSARFKGIGKLRSEKRAIRSAEDYIFIKSHIDDWYLPPEKIEELQPARIEEANSTYKSRATTEILKEVKAKRLELNLDGYADELRKLDREGLMGAFRDLAKKAGVSTQIGMYQVLRGHNLRKLFYTLLRNDGADLFTIEFFMGHTIPEEREAYFHAIPTKLKELYARYMPSLLMEFEGKSLESEEYRDLATRAEDQQRKIEAQERKIAALEEQLAARSQKDDFMNEFMEKMRTSHEFKAMLRQMIQSE